MERVSIEKMHINMGCKQEIPEIWGFLNNISHWKHH